MKKTPAIIEMSGEGYRFKHAKLIKKIKNKCKVKMQELTGICG